VLRSRVDTSASGTSTHFAVYDFIPDVLASNPLFGLGLNNFSVYYEFVTGRTNFGPHSFYVATIVETGLVGTLLFAAFLWYLFRRLGRLRAIGRTLASPRIRPLAWGMTAALAGTMAANAFYLTMQFYYFFAFATLALAAPIVFARRLR
jgi:O-antigen ligase